MAFVCSSTFELVGQTLDGNGSPSFPSSNGASAETDAAQLSAVIYREIDDPFTGARWFLLKDSNHPGGPGRLVLASESGGVSGISPSRRIEAGPRLKAAAPIPVIHTGDRLIVEEHNAVLDERLEAVALGPAAMGSSLGVRLQIGSKVFSAVALGPGRVTFAPKEGRQP